MTTKTPLLTALTSAPSIWAASPQSSATHAALARALAADDCETVSRAVSAGLAVDHFIMTAAISGTLLDCALAQRAQRVALWLIDNGAALSTTRNPSMYAAACWSAEITSALLAAGLSPEEATEDGFHAIFACAGYGDIGALEALLQWPGAAIDALELHAAAQHAAEHWNAAALRLLQRYGADLAQRDLSGATLLHWTAEHTSGRGITAFAECASILIAGGVDINAQCEAGQCALLELLDSGHIAPARWLLEHGADAMVATPCGQSPLLLAARKHLAQTLRCMFDHGADGTLRLACNQTLLHFAAKSDTVGSVGEPPDFGATVAILLQAGTEIDATDDEGLTAESLAARSGLDARAALLGDAGETARRSQANQ